MKANPSKDGVLTLNSAGIGTVTRKMVRERAVELALINGRPSQDVSKADWEQAKLELTGELETGSHGLDLETIPESERWDPIGGSPGRKMPVAGSDDEDVEGRSDQERLVDEGVAGAEHDQMLQAARQDESEDRETS